MVKRYKSAGLVTLGKTNTPEFGLNFSTEPILFGPTLNPWDTRRSTGGSSGGSAAVVAARMVPMAHGSDGAGSIRVPSSCCGLFGLKPSRGRMPEEAWEDLATNHVLTRSVRDSASMLDATSAPYSGNPNTLPSPNRPFLEEVGENPGNLKIAFFTKENLTHPNCIAAVTDAANLCESLGHTVEEAQPNLNDENIWDHHSIIAGISMAASLDQIFFGWYQSGLAMADKLEPHTWNLALWGRQLTSTNLERAKAIHKAAEETLLEFLTTYDLILTPTMGIPPAKLGFFDTVNLAPGELGLRMFNTIQFPWVYNDTGLPAMSVPLYWSELGLPIGTQFMGRFGDEAALFRLAAQLEQARPWAGRQPPLQD